MYQISIGDESAWLILDGASVSGCYKKAAIFFTFSNAETVKEHLEIHLSGSHSEIKSALENLGRLMTRAEGYQRGTYESPQYLRCKLTSTGEYYFSPISDIYFGASKESYITRSRGSMIIHLYYK